MKHIKLFESFLNEKSVNKNLAENWLERYVEKTLNKEYGELTWAGNKAEEENEYAIDSDNKSVWVEIKLVFKKFQEVNKALSSDYESFAKSFHEAANKAGFSAEIFTNSDENSITYRISFEE